MDLELDHLGFADAQLRWFRDAVRQSQGFVLVTGPTGSGKTTTLYSALRALNTPRRKLMTLEDPVEYRLEGIVQMQVDPEIGLSFDQGLRSILRQSPEVILVGEIRDPPTADIAIRAALTGHLVFSTVHSNDAPGAFERLRDLRVDSHLLASSMEGVVAQRLVRTICDHCRESHRPGSEYLDQLGFPREGRGDVTFQRGIGCRECRWTGYRGRTAIVQVLPTSSAKVKRKIIDDVPVRKLRRFARRRGMRTLREHGFEKVCAGVTTLTEVARVTRPPDGGGNQRSSRGRSMDP